MCSFLWNKREKISHSNWISIYEEILVVCSRVVSASSRRENGSMLDIRWQEKGSARLQHFESSHTILLPSSFHAVDCVSRAQNSLEISFLEILETFFFRVLFSVSSWMAQLWFNNPHSECHLIYLSDVGESLLLESRSLFFFSFCNKLIIYRFEAGLFVICKRREAVWTYRHEDDM